MKTKTYFSYSEAASLSGLSYSAVYLACHPEKRKKKDSKTDKSVVVKYRRRLKLARPGKPFPIHIRDLEEWCGRKINTEDPATAIDVSIRNEIQSLRRDLDWLRMQNSNTYIANPHILEKGFGNRIL